MTTWLMLVAVAFAFVNGVNDGAALLSVGLSVRGIRPLVGLLVASVAVAVTPLVTGTRVATTLTSRLVALDGMEGALALQAGVITAVAVTWLLAARGLPTSLTLALVGAIAGAGVGASLPVSWVTVTSVLLLAVAAPLVGLLVAWTLNRLITAWPSRRRLNRRIRRWHLGGFALQCVAYGANDAQKMLAVFAVAAGTAGSGSSGGVPAVPWHLLAISSTFLMGSMIGLPRVARTLGGGLVPARPHEAVITEMSSATVVLGTGLLGSPVSMTQAISGGLVGAALDRGFGAIRWRAAVRLVLAWLVTLPVAFGAAAAVTRLLLTVR